MVRSRFGSAALARMTPCIISISSANMILNFVHIETTQTLTGHWHRYNYNCVLAINVALHKGADHINKLFVRVLNKT
jgi:hypothetical protein